VSYSLSGDIEYLRRITEWESGNITFLAYSICGFEIAVLASVRIKDNTAAAVVVLFLSKFIETMSILTITPNILTLCSFSFSRMNN
jgi:hypothetical protein